MAKKDQPRLKVNAPRHFLKQWRRYRDLTQEELAGMVEMSVATISQLENGKQGYRQETLEALADALGCGPGDLLIRNPLDGAPIWSLWERLTPAQRRQVAAMIEALIVADQVAFA